MSSAAASSSSSPDSPLKLVEIPGRGRALIAARDIKPGEIILSDSPILLYPSFSHSSSSPFCPLCFRSLDHDENHHCRSSPRSPWLAETLARLPSLLSDPDLLSSASFLASALDLHPSSLSLLLSLHGFPSRSPSFQTATLTLHSLLSSLSPPHPLTLDLTASLLAKDQMNAFGLMEPFREEDLGERRVRAYGIYPKASFFNHDCLPNACRFDYLDGDGKNNADIVVRAIHEIPEGREVCLSYFPVKWDYKERQRRLLEEYGFQCGCDRCQVEKNWKDDDEGVEEMQEEEEEEDDFPHAYFFMRYVCESENCGGTLAPLPPAPDGTPSKVMECNVCGRLTPGEDSDGDDEMVDD